MRPDITDITAAIRSRNELHLDDTQLESVLAWWQSALGLDAWSIELRTQRGFRMDGNDGKVTFKLNTRSAYIDLLTHEDHSPDYEPLDQEQVIVHELLHILFASLSRKLNSDEIRMSDVEVDVCIEQPIDWIAYLLVTLRRAPKGTLP